MKSKKNKVIDAMDQEAYATGFQDGVASADKMRNKKAPGAYWNKFMGMALLVLSGTILGTGLGNALMTVVSCLVSIFIGGILVLRAEVSV